ncbi:hypothetical protein SCLCIDRAFT_1216047 [Scleroderma citrinum Foug A]|uniref:Uncharacterized protein n=1 Tax=Scleroderma citrinum Foug A TaxID=1036808 RepID=A0A0C2ZIW9_9AGAM|nr:hypothetical protein SCLCIDRAFT_1216047 [Scleroderma citrinum Foug A]
MADLLGPASMSYAGTKARKHSHNRSRHVLPCWPEKTVDGDEIFPSHGCRKHSATHILRRAQPSGRETRSRHSMPVTAPYTERIIDAPRLAPNLPGKGDEVDTGISTEGNTIALSC